MPREDPLIRLYDREALEAQTYLRTWSEQDLWLAAAPPADPLDIEGFDAAAARVELRRRERQAREAEKSHQAFEAAWSRMGAQMDAVAQRERDRRRFAADQERRRQHAISTQAEIAREERHADLRRMFGGS